MQDIRHFVKQYFGAWWNTEYVKLSQKYCGSIGLRVIFKAMGVFFNVELNNPRSFCARQWEPLMTSSDNRCVCTSDSNRPFYRLPSFVKIVAVTIFLVSLTFMVAGLFILKRQKEILYLEKVKAGEMILHHFVHNAGILLLGDDTLSLNTLIKEAMYVNGIVYTVIVDSKNVIKAHTDPAKIGTIQTTTLSPGPRVLNLSRPVTFGNKTVGSVYMGLSLDYIQDEMKQTTFLLLQPLLFLGLFVILIVIGTAFWLGMRLTRPMYKKSSMGKTLEHRITLGESPAMENRVSHRPPNITRNQVTVLFAGPKGFKAHANTRNPEEVLRDLNEYFAIATSSIVDYGGYIDKFVGDAVIGVFESSLLRADHTERAVRSAVAMQRALRDAGKNGNQLLGIVGIGISAGVALSGHIGSHAKKEYTFIGESFKVAYSLNVMAGPGEIVMSRDVYQLIDQVVSVEPLPPRETMARTEPWENFRLKNIVESKGDG